MAHASVGRADREVCLGYTAQLFCNQRRRRVTPDAMPSDFPSPESARAMEINPIVNAIKDLSERTQVIRGYL